MHMYDNICYMFSELYVIAKTNDSILVNYAIQRERGKAR